MHISDKEIKSIVKPIAPVPKMMIKSISAPKKYSQVKTNFADMVKQKSIVQVSSGQNSPKSKKSTKGIFNAFTGAFDSPGDRRKENDQRNEEKYTTA